MKYEKTAKRLMKALSDKNMRAQELANITGIGKSSISQYVNGSHAPSNISAGKMAKALEVSPLWLMGFDVEDSLARPGIEDKSEQDAFAEGSGEQGGLHLVSVEDLPNVLPIYRHSIPVYRGIACGAPIEAAEHADYYAVSKEPIKANFAVIAKGDSMIDARIHDGDIVFIEKCSTVDNGEIAAVLIDGAATLKRVYYDADKEILSLVSENKAYAPMVYTKEDARDIRIMGRAVCAQIFF